MDNTSRVPAGVTAGGQFTATLHSEPSLDLHVSSVDGPDFDYAFEADRGPGLRKELEALPKISARSATNASHLPDLIRDSYPEYFTNGEAPQSRAGAVPSLEAALPNLPHAERQKQLELIRFAVHEEMKHWADRGHVLNPEHGYELLIDPSNYSGEDDLLENGQDENRERWETLANTAAHHAIVADHAAATASPGAA